MPRKQLGIAATKSKKSTPSPAWFCRVDGNREFLVSKCDVLSKAMDVIEFIAAYHEGKTKENPHVHFCIRIDHEVQWQSMSVRIKKLFDVKDSNYACEIWDGNHGLGAVSYLFHEEGVDPICVKGFSEQDIVDARAANEAVQAVVAVNKERASTKIPDKLVKEFTGKLCERWRMIKWCVEEARAGRLYWPGEFMLKKYIEEAEILMLNDEDIETYAYKMERRMWRD